MVLQVKHGVYHGVSGRGGDIMVTLHKERYVGTARPGVCQGPEESGISNNSDGTML